MDKHVETVFRDASTRVGANDMIDEAGRGAFRPIARGTRGAVSSGHLLASMAGYDMLRQGGNAADAGVASGLCLCVVEHDRTSIGGVSPIIYYDAARNIVETVSGLGRWPKAVSLDYFEREHGGKFTPGPSTSLTPLGLDGWLVALTHYGTKTFGEVVEQAIAYAVDGFPVGELLREDIIEYADGFRSWPMNAATFMPGGEVPPVGMLLKQPALAASLRRLVDVERRADSEGRESAIQAVRDYFYRGEMGEEIVAFSRKHGGLLSIEDMVDAEARVEPPVKLSFGDYEVYSCDAWTQGPALLQTLAILKGYDLKALGHNSADYVHTLTEAIKIAFADRDAYYGDPDFIHVPHEELLSEAYCAERRTLLDPAKALPTMPPCGRVKGAEPYFGRTPPHKDEPAQGDQKSPDTTVCSAIDSQGNIFCSAPSDPALRHIIDEKLGFGISPRGTQSWLHPNHPSVLAPGKRPRLTTNPILVLRKGRPYMSLCTPGGDVQQQANLQVFLNIVVFGMNVQAASEAPRFCSFSFPNSFYPHFMRDGEVALEGRFGDEIIENLERRGHKVRRWPDWSANVGGSCVIVRDDENGVLHAGADPRRDAYAVAW